VHFDHSNFEQLCINYANKALQHHDFNKRVFQCEEEEYDDEGILQEFDSFPINRDVLDLINNKKLGLFPYLMNYARLPLTTMTTGDKRYAKCLYEDVL
jgi:myosin heavy subunit